MSEEIAQVVDHLFRHEAGKMVAYLTKIFGLNRLALAEDVVQDTLCAAMVNWAAQGLPANPAAWLMRTARNRAIDLVRRDEQFCSFVPEFTHLLRIEQAQVEELPVFASEIADDQLRMMLSCCHPELSVAIQVTLILKTLCGFSVAEIAHALLSRQDAIEKRLTRARKLFQAAGPFTPLVAIAALPERLDGVLQAIYLLFNEGYHSGSADQTVREELCFEAMRLAVLLSEHEVGKAPRTYALLALMCFHAARLPTRMDDMGCLVQLAMQDRALWDRSLLAQGFLYLEQSASGEALDPIHIESAIASLHCGAPTYAATDWAKILSLYDSLLRIHPSPIVALNRAVALGNAQGYQAGLVALKALAADAKLQEYPFLPAAMGEFQLLAGAASAAHDSFALARALARGQAEQEFFGRRMAACGLSE